MSGKVVFKKVRWKNLLSTGNTWTEISLDDYASTLIIGDNGSGKSTFIDALCFGLYGKPFRNIRKGQLVNSINQKNCEVEIELFRKNKNYVIKRGIKPDIFEIWAEGVMLNQSSESKDYQAYLEKHILGFNLKTFTQIVIAGSRSFVPFMQLSAADRRNFIEYILDIQVFSTMSAVNKSRLNENKTDLEKNKIELDGKKGVLTMIEKTIFRLEENNEDKIKELKNDIMNISLKRATLETEAYSLNLEKEKLKNMLVNDSKIRSKHEKMIILKSKISANRNSHLENYKFFLDNCTCPTCNQTIEESSKEKELEKINSKIEELDKGLYDLDKEILDHKEIIDENQKIQNELNRIVSDLRLKEQEIQQLIIRHKTISDQIKALEKGNDQVLLEQKENKNKTEQEILILEDKHKTLLDDNVVITTASDLLKDGGIKTKIIKQYVPIINKTINKYLTAMGFLVHFELDETFNETIKSRYRDDFSYDSFSEGEKFRIDLALMLAWRAIAKTKNSVDTNLLILDEIFDGSLDDAGIDEMMKIMQGLTKDTNMFIISHKKDQMIDKFERVFKASKKKNFSFIEEV